MVDSVESTLYIMDGTLYQYLQTPIYNMMELPELPDLSENNLRSLTIYGPQPEVPEDASGEGEESSAEEGAESAAEPEAVPRPPSPRSRAMGTAPPFGSAIP